MRTTHTAGGAHVPTGIRTGTRPSAARSSRSPASVRAATAVRAVGSVLVPASVPGSASVPGFGPGFGPGFRPERGRGRRGARRGDVRAAVLALLLERPMHGYELIQQIEERSGGVWRPSPGSIYPTLQLLADEGLVSGDESGGRRLFTLTDAGREEACPVRGPVAVHPGAGRELRGRAPVPGRDGSARDGGLAGRPGRHRGAAGRDPRRARRGAPPGLPAAGRRRVGRVRHSAASDDGSAGPAPETPPAE